MKDIQDPGESRPAAAATGVVAVSDVGLLPGARRRRVLSSRRKWLFRLIALGFPFVCLYLLELALNWMGAGKDLRLVVPAETSTPRGIVRFNPDSDLAYFDAINLAGPEPRPFALAKATGTFRIIVIGASTVEGFPYSTALAFPRLLEICLQQQGIKRNFEVLNAGSTSITSTCEAEVLSQAVACAPDLIVVYTGHNEFIGPGGVGSKLPFPSPGWAPAYYAARRTRLLQVASRLFPKVKPEKRNLFEQLQGDMSILLNSPKFRQAEQNLRTNLERMIRIADAARVPLLFTAPVVNLRSQSPLMSLSRDGLSDGEMLDWQNAMKLGERLLQQKDHLAALDAFDHARTIDDGHALLAFRRAQCLEGLDRWEEAFESYQAASDLDCLRIRAPSTFAKLVADVAGAARPGSLVQFLDTASEFARGAPHGIPGDESLVEHVHFTYSGNWRLAIILAEFITRNVLAEPWQTQLVPSLADRDDLCGAMIQDHCVANAFVVRMHQQPPLNMAPDVELHIQAMQSEFERVLGELSYEDRVIMMRLGITQLLTDIIRSLALAYEGAEMFREQKAVLRRGIVRQPWRPELLLDLAEGEFRDGNDSQARALLKQAEPWKPNRVRLRDLQQQLDRADNP